MADPTSTRVFATAAQGPQGPSFRLRCMVLTEATARHGIALDCEPLLNAGEARRFSDGGLADRARLVLGARRRLRESYVRRREATDTVLIQRQADFLPTLSLERELAKDKRLILDVDDAIWLDSRGAGGHPLAALKRSARKVEWLAARADHIVAGNELLAEHLGRFNPEVSVVPTLIDTDASRARSGPSPSDEEVVLGWTGSASTSAYLGALGPELERFAATLSPTPVRLLVVGGPAPRLAGISSEEIGWSVEAEESALARMDIGLMPLPDTPWNRGKCAFKALRYMAAGVPVVADDVGVARATIGAGGTVIDSPTAWAEPLLALARDPDARERAGRTGRERVVAEFSIERWAPELARIWAGS